jgi:hypothetical protein
METETNEKNVLNALNETWKQLSRMATTVKDETRTALHHSVNIEILNENEFQATVTNGHFLVSIVLSDARLVDSLQREGEYYRHDDYTYSLQFSKKHTCKIKDRFTVKPIPYLYSDFVSFNRSTFPKWKSLIPQGEGNSLSEIGIGIAASKDLNQCLEAIGCKSYRMRFYGALKPILIESGQFKGIAVLMPSKLERVME